MKIAVVQQNHAPGMAEENRRKALASAEEALEHGADLILFHEEMTVGYSPLARELAEPVCGETSLQFQKLLERRNSDARIVYGLTEKKDGKFYISAPVISRTGPVAVYRKTHLYRNAEGLRDEGKVFTPGDRFIFFDFQGLRFGLMICYDGDFTEPVEYYRRMGCQVVLWMNNRPSRGPEDLVRFHAIRNSMMMCVSCCCGTDELGNACPGGSNIVDAAGNVRSVLWESEGILYGTADRDEIMELREKNFWIRDRREDLYGVPASE